MRAPSSVRSRQPHLGSYGSMCGQKSLQREVAGGGGGGMGRPVTETGGDSDGLEVRVLKVHPNCAGAPRQDSFPMLRGVPQCVPSLRHPW